MTDRDAVKLLQDWRSASGLTLEALANREGVTRQAVWQWVHGELAPGRRRCSAWAQSDDSALRAVGRAFLAQYYDGLRVQRAPAPTPPAAGQ